VVEEERECRDLPAVQDAVRVGVVFGEERAQVIDLVGNGLWSVVTMGSLSQVVVFLLPVKH
jgi:hypothetical protein